ncbi:MAG: peptidase [Candidatus Handelsmanbacteria bacterium RIFCSPLOWO2_12_FULL_64_10]|uniref:Peptidase n=1 Tax=Handelsmanbacteria sp. (strain RIFCSPLOWO2_12_FULL_64_10) TaxID=1817868 RepID=A0A1F6CT02_HANXR|nr:MAG: peptidase [Candidatus Handelsmanbacteria bacterium RIFCSPLOWO2_12_FULL_64_10]
MNRLFGLETEYGITIEGVKEVDVVEESMQIIRCYLQHDFVPLWDYALENPRRDVRGFEVDHLLNDDDEKIHLQRDRKRKVPFKELKSDLIIFNGARLYNDHTHPEYSTPECWSLFDLVAQDRAGERILRMCARKRTEMLTKGAVRLYKNNTDFDGHSYGCHENYLMRRDVPFERIVHGLLPFFATRQVFAGAGKVGVEQGDRATLYQISQRGEFFEVIASVDTMHKRPLINTRDEPHADPQKYRRLHVIVGDANMSEVITALKVGTTALVIDLIEDGDLPGLALKDPVIAVKDVARDQTRKWLVQLTDGRLMPAVDIQREYLRRAEGRYAGRDAETDWTLRRWAGVLDDLEADPMRLVGVCDWVTKKWLLDQFAEAEGLSWEDEDHVAWLQSQDLEYSNIDPESGLYHLLESQGQALRLTSEEDVARAMITPPAETRGYFRGRSLERFGGSVKSVNWDSIVFGVNGSQRSVDLKGFVEREVASRYNAALDNAKTLEELLAALP